MLDTERSALSPQVETIQQTLAELKAAAQTPASASSSSNAGRSGAIGAVAARAYTKKEPARTPTAAAANIIPAATITKTKSQKRRARYSKVERCTSDGYEVIANDL